VKSFTTAKKRRDPLEFTLDEDTPKERTLRFVPQKVSGMVMDLFDDDDESKPPAKAAMDWLSDGLSEEDNDYLIARLKDPEDDFDFPDLGRIVKWLVGEVTGRPTGPRRG